MTNTLGYDVNHKFQTKNHLHFILGHGMLECLLVRNTLACFKKTRLSHSGKWELHLKKFYYTCPLLAPLTPILKASQMVMSLVDSVEKPSVSKTPWSSKL